MFAKLSYCRKPTITYKRKARPECTIAIDDDSDDSDGFENLYVQKTKLEPAESEPRKQPRTAYDCLQGTLAESKELVAEASHTIVDKNQSLELASPSISSTHEDAVNDSLDTAVTGPDIENNDGSIHMASSAMNVEHDRPAESIGISAHGDAIRDNFDTAVIALDTEKTDETNCMQCLAMNVDDDRPTEGVDAVAETPVPSNGETRSSVQQTVQESSQLSANGGAQASSFDIFDFPEDDSSQTEIELVVASLKTTPKQPTQNKVYQNTSMRQPGRKTSRPQHASLDADTPLPRLQVRARASSSKINSAQSSAKRKKVHFSSDVLVTTFNTASLDKADTVISSERLRSDDGIENGPTRLCSVNTASPDSIIDLTNDDDTVDVPSEKPRRNLVLRLKSATGQAMERNLSSLRQYRFEDDDDDDEDDDIEQIQLPFGSDDQDSDKENTESEEMGYRERMEMELSALIENEIGVSDPAYAADLGESFAVPPTNRPRYQPQNAINVQVTYRRNNRTPEQILHNDQDILDIQSLLTRLNDEDVL